MKSKVTESACGCRFPNPRQSSLDSWKSGGGGSSKGRAQGDEIFKKFARMEVNTKDGRIGRRDKSPMAACLKFWDGNECTASESKFCDDSPLHQQLSGTRWLRSRRLGHVPRRQLGRTAVARCRKSRTYCRIRRL